MSFLRSCIYLVVVIFIGSLMANFMFSLDVLPVESNPGLQNVNDTNFFVQMTTLEMDSDSGEPVSIADMDGFWELITVGAIGSVVLMFITKSIVPLGLYVFGAVFFSVWVKTSYLLEFAAILPEGFVNIISVCVVLLFCAASVGVMTGGG